MVKLANVVTVVLTAMIILCGCESSTPLPPQGSTANATPAALATGTTASHAGIDDIDISRIAWLGENYSGASISATINSASLDSDTIVTSYEPYSWPRTTVKVSVDAICCLFYEKNGQIVGGKFDYWRAGGQATKDLENVHHRYQGHSFPGRGTKTYTMIVSVNGTQRSNIRECSWR